MAQHRVGGARSREDELEQVQTRLCCLGCNEWLVDKSRSLTRSLYFQAFCSAVTLWVLISSDLRDACFPPSSDWLTDTVTAIAIVLFAFEIVANLLITKNYLFSFYFWLDIVSTVSLVLDINWVTDNLYGSPGSAASAATIVRASRSSKLGTRAGRLMSVVRIVRLVRMFRLFRTIEKFKSGDKGAVNSNQDLWQRAVQAGESSSMVGKKLADLTTRRVVMLVLTMMFILPLFSTHEGLYGEPSSAAVVSLESLHDAALQGASNDTLDAIVDEVESSLPYEIFGRETSHLLHLDVLNVTYVFTELNVGRPDEFVTHVIMTPGCSSDHDAECLVSSIIVDQKWLYQVAAILSICKTCFVVGVLLSGSLLFSRDTNRLVLVPLDRMLNKIHQIQEDPLLFREQGAVSASISSTSQRMPSATPKRSWLRSITKRSNKGEQDTVDASRQEMQLLETSIDKIWMLLALAFGDAGAKVIAENVKQAGDLNVMMPGKREVGIFGFCDIRSFTTVTSVLQESIMEFVNVVAHIVHSEVHRHGGSANKNIGDAFLLVWKFPTHVNEEQLEKLVASFVRVRQLPSKRRPTVQWDSTSSGRSLSVSDNVLKKTLTQLPSMKGCRRVMLDKVDLLQWSQSSMFGKERPGSAKRGSIDAAHRTGTRALTSLFALAGGHSNTPAGAPDLESLGERQRHHSQPTRTDTIPAFGTGTKPAQAERSPFTLSRFPSQVCKRAPKGLPSKGLPASDSMVYRPDSPLPDVPEQGTEPASTSDTSAHGVTATSVELYQEHLAGMAGPAHIASDSNSINQASGLTQELQIRPPAALAVLGSAQPSTSTSTSPARAPPPASMSRQYEHSTSAPEGQARGAQGQAPVVSRVNRSLHMNYKLSATSLNVHDKLNAASSSQRASRLLGPGDHEPVRSQLSQAHSSLGGRSNSSWNFSAIMNTVTTLGAQQAAATPPLRMPSMRRTSRASRSSRGGGSTRTTQHDARGTRSDETAALSSRNASMHGPPLNLLLALNESLAGGDSRRPEQGANLRPVGEGLSVDGMELPADFGSGGLSCGVQHANSYGPEWDGLRDVGSRLNERVTFAQLAASAPTRSGDDHAVGASAARVSRQGSVSRQETALSEEDMLPYLATARRTASRTMSSFDDKRRSTSLEQPLEEIWRGTYIDVPSEERGTDSDRSTERASEHRKRESLNTLRPQSSMHNIRMQAATVTNRLIAKVSSSLRGSSKRRDGLTWHDSVLRSGSEEEKRTSASCSPRLGSFSKRETVLKRDRDSGASKPEEASVHNSVTRVERASNQPSSGAGQAVSFALADDVLESCGEQEHGSGQQLSRGSTLTRNASRGLSFKLSTFGSRWKQMKRQASASDGNMRRAASSAGELGGKSSSSPSETLPGPPLDVELQMEAQRMCPSRKARAKSVDGRRAGPPGPVLLPDPRAHSETLLDSRMTTHGSDRLKQRRTTARLKQQVTELCRTVASVADMALLSFVATNVALARSDALADYANDETLQRLLPRYRVRMGYGLHYGWSIEGPIGSKFKVDASYLSPHVNIAARLESATKQYGVDLLLSEAFVALLSVGVRGMVRQVDCVNLVGVPEPVAIFTFDMDVDDVEADGFVDSMPEYIYKALGDYNLDKRSQARAPNLGVHFQSSDHVTRSWSVNYNFLQLWHEGFEAYISGEWAIAKQVFEVTLKVHPNREDGPSRALLDFMAKHHFTAPQTWRGHRELHEK